MLGIFSAKKEVPCGVLACLLLVLCFWFVLAGPGNDFGPILDRPESILGRFWADVGRFWDDFWLNFDPIGEASSSIAKLSSASSPKRAGGDTRSVKNF